MAVARLLFGLWNCSSSFRQSRPLVYRPAFALNAAKEPHFTFWALDEDRRPLDREAFSNSQRDEVFRFNMTCPALRVYYLSLHTFLVVKTSVIPGLV